MWLAPLGGVQFGRTVTRTGIRPPGGCAARSKQTPVAFRCRALATELSRMEPSRACLPHPSPSTSRRVRTRPAMTKQELRAWCRQRYGSEWWASPAKAQRLEEARKALHCNSTTIARNEHRLVMPPASTAALPQPPISGGAARRREPPFQSALASLPQPPLTTPVSSSCPPTTGDRAGGSSRVAGELQNAPAPPPPSTTAPPLAMRRPSSAVPTRIPQGEMIDLQVMARRLAKRPRASLGDMARAIRTRDSGFLEAYFDDHDDGGFFSS